MLALDTRRVPIGQSTPQTLSASDPAPAAAIVFGRPFRAANRLAQKWPEVAGSEWHHCHEPAAVAALPALCHHVVFGKNGLGRFLAIDKRGREHLVPVRVRRNYGWKLWGMQSVRVWSTGQRLARPIADLTHVPCGCAIESSLAQTAATSFLSKEQRGQDGTQRGESCLMIT